MSAGPPRPLPAQPSWSSPRAAHRPRGAPAVVLEALLEAPPLLLGGLPAALACVLGEERGSGSRSAEVSPPLRPHIPWRSAVCCPAFRRAGQTRDPQPAWPPLQAGVPSVTMPWGLGRQAFGGCHALAHSLCRLPRPRRGTWLPVPNSACTPRAHGQRPLPSPPGTQVEQSPFLGSVTLRPRAAGTPGRPYVGGQWKPLLLQSHRGLLGAVPVGQAT